MSVTTLPREKVAVPVVKAAGTELELKFLVSEPAFKASQGWPVLVQGAPRRAQRVRSFYYDTASGALHRNKMALRMRKQRRGFLLTLKYDGAAVAKAAGGEALVLAYETDIRRITHRLVTPGGEIELAFDAGYIIAGGEKMPVREIELELKAGEKAELFRVGIELAQNFPVRLGTLTKSERGFLLLTGTQPGAVRAGLALAGAPRADEAIFGLISGCLAQFTGNFAAFESGDSRSAIHQMRVALRRLRALLGLFRRTFPCAEFLSFREEAKFLASAMNEARDLDVFMELVRDGPEKIFSDEAGFAEIMAACAARRQGEYERIKALLAAPETTRFVLALQSVLARRVWRNGLGGEALARLVAPARDFAAEQIRRMHEKILKRGGKNLQLTPLERHELRIRIKKLRYAAESFSGVVEARKQVRGYVQSVARLQDALGNFNDLVVARQIVEGLTARHGRAAGIILGWCARGAVLDEALVESWREFRRGGSPF